MALVVAALKCTAHLHRNMNIDGVGTRQAAILFLGLAMIVFGGAGLLFA